MDAINICTQGHLHTELIGSAMEAGKRVMQKGVPLVAPLEDSVRTPELLHAIRDSHNLEIRVPVHQVGKTG